MTFAVVAVVVGLLLLILAATESAIALSGERRNRGRTCACSCRPPAARSVRRNGAVGRPFADRVTSVSGSRDRQIPEDSAALAGPAGLLAHSIGGRISGDLSRRLDCHGGDGRLAKSRSRKSAGGEGTCGHGMSQPWPWPGSWPTRWPTITISRGVRRSRGGGADHLCGRRFIGMVRGRRAALPQRPRDCDAACRPLRGWRACPREFHRDASDRSARCLQPRRPCGRPCAGTPIRRIVSATIPLFLQDATPWPVNLSWALLSDRRSCFAGRELTLVYARSSRARLEKSTRSSFASSTARARPTISAIWRWSSDAALVVVTAQDGAWTRDPFAASPYYRLVESKADAWRIYKGSAVGLPSLPHRKATVTNG